MEERTSCQWALFSLVFAKLDCNALARASCVSKGWREVVSQEELWEGLCMRRWSSLSSPQGKTLLLQQGGSFKKFYRLRAQAQSQHTKCFLDRPKLPSLPLKDLFFLLDVSHHGLPVTSSIAAADHLLPSFIGDGVQDSSFDFSIPISTYMPRAWSKEEVEEFEVSWAITARGSQRIFQLLKTSNDKGDDGGVARALGNTCTYAQALPSPGSCACITSLCMSPYDDGGCKDNIRKRPSTCQVQVNLECACTRLPCVSPSGCIYVYSDFRPFRASFSIFDTLSLSCLSQAQVLSYLQHALFHHCTTLSS